MQFYRRSLPSMCIDFTSDEGKSIFSEALAAGHLNSFFKLSAQFRTQDEPAYCGLTSLVVALNVLEIDPGRIWKGPWRWYHEEMLDCCTPLNIIKQKGINMEQFLCLARCNNLKAIGKRISDISTIEEFRSDVMDACTRDDVVMIVSYSREALQQTGDGHFSPIAGYHKDRDLVLILDTARFKYPPHWVSLQALLEAMTRVDNETGKSRGYICLSRGKNSSLMFTLSSQFSVDNRLNLQLFQFDEEWKRWSQCMIQENARGEDILEEAVSHLLDLVLRKQMAVELFAITLQCTRSSGSEAKLSLKSFEKSRSMEQEKVTCILLTLLQQFEDLQSYQYVQNLIAHLTVDEQKIMLSVLQCCMDAPTSQQDTACCGTCCCKQAKEMSQAKGKIAYPVCQSCSPQPVVGVNHLVTLFLHVWPHHLGIKGSSVMTSNTSGTAPKKGQLTKGSVLIKFLSTDLSMSDGQLAREEIETIKYRFTELINYHEQFTLKCC